MASTATGYLLAASAEALWFTDAAVPAQAPGASDAPIGIPSIPAATPAEVGTDGLLQLHDPYRTEPLLRSDPILLVASAPVRSGASDDISGLSVLEPDSLDVLSPSRLVPVV